MNQEISLERILFDVIMFFDRNKRLIISMTLFAIIGVFLFQKLKPSFYETTAIATSGISEYVGIEISEDDDMRNQRMAINLINDLQLDVDKEDYEALTKKMTNLSIELASQIKFIEAEPLLRQDKDEKFHNTADFQINLLVRDANIIEHVQLGLEDYFENNKYIAEYWFEFKKGNEDLKKAIEDEIEDLQSFRDELITKESLTEISNSSNYLASNNEQTIANDIIILEERKRKIERDIKLIKPLSFSKPFTQTTVAEREVLVWGTAIGFVAFILSIIIAIIREVKQKSLKETK
ncbi:MAG: hypothetical protein HN702_05000 [Flavobacteriales bacterium]|nr:hypothetical protein [Flavobacteriales bacterium]MBT5354206.1 hypothetical protein [Flavobacteriales bacterium]MBT5699207.1 hypothetical protein [Flavobacteriales bacterium]MBT7726728.1 hypothetical protein [Flavobacteriales bacterium]